MYKKMLYYAALAGQLSRKRPNEMWDTEENPAKAAKCRRLCRSPTGAPPNGCPSAYAHGGEPSKPATREPAHRVMGIEGAHARKVCQESAAEGAPRATRAALKPAPGPINISSKVNPVTPLKVRP